ncbi:MAG: lysophospholipid acyltransferase family protein [Campylobacteraceae bacterium]|nr:lysophospholipid acyltransferase family protein [Campylobacteraceae bacterium]
MKSKFLRKITYKILPFIASLAQRVLFLTCKKVYELPQDEMPTPLIWVAWHGQLLMLPCIYRKLKPSSHEIHVMVSEHTHGDMAISVAKRFGMSFIRGSSRQGAIKALRQAIDTLNRGVDVGITPDGPKGPLYSVSDGAIILSTKCDAHILAVGWSASSYWQLGSWDAAKIPKPFSTVIFRASEPFKLGGLSKEEAKERVKDEIMRCMGK